MGKGGAKSTKIKNTLPRRMYKERGQLSHREHLGLLEKRKDYKRRSTDFKNKDKVLSKYSIPSQVQIFHLWQVLIDYLSFLVQRGSIWSRNWGTQTSSTTRCTMHKWWMVNTKSCSSPTRKRHASWERIKTWHWSTYTEWSKRRRQRRWRKVCTWLTSLRTIRISSLSQAMLRSRETTDCMHGMRQMGVSLILKQTWLQRRRDPSWNRTSWKCSLRTSSNTRDLQMLWGSPISTRGFKMHSSLTSIWNRKARRER